MECVLRLYDGLYYGYSFFFHRASAAFLAISFFLFAESLAALAFPPFSPPKRPRATAAGFFPGVATCNFSGLSSAVASATIDAASWLISRGRFFFGVVMRQG